MSYFTQMAGLAYHNFTSAAVGIALAIAFIRGIARRQKETIGNFWVDMTRATLWVLLPICMVGALLLVSQGVVQNLRPYDKATLVEPQQVPHLGADGKPAVDASGKPVMDTVTEQTIAQGPVASQEVIKQFGTNGGGFFNANSAHPFENPTPFSNFIEMFGIFAISAGLTYTLGRMTGSQRHGWAVWAAMAILFLCGVTVAYWAEARGNPLLAGVEPARYPPSSPAATWRARKPASASPTPRSSRRRLRTQVAAPSSAGMTPSLRSAAWFRWST